MGRQHWYARSLFERLAGSNQGIVQLLDEQYRMPLELAAFPSRQFYEGRVRTATSAVPPRILRTLPVLRVFNVGYGTMTHRGTSFQNKDEAKLVTALLSEIQQAHRANPDSVRSSHVQELCMGSTASVLI